MYNEIIKTLIEIEKHNKNNWYSEFSNMYSSDYGLFSDTLIKLRNTNLECIHDESLIDTINNCSSLFSGKDVILLDIILLMLYFEIDVQENIKKMLSVFQSLKFETQHIVMSVIYDTHLTRIFTKTFITHQNNNLTCKIMDYIDVNTIDTIQTAELYYSVVKKKHPSVFKQLPKKILCIGMVSEAFGIIDGDGLGCLYRYFKKDYITTLCDFLIEIGGGRFANIIIYGADYRKDHKKLDHLENKIYNLEKKTPIDKLLNNYLKNNQGNQGRRQSGDGSMIEP